MIKNILRRNPDISGCELYGKLKKKGYSRHPDSLYRVLRRPGYRDVIQWKCQTVFRPIMVRSLPIGWTQKEYILLTNSVQN